VLKHSNHSGRRTAITNWAIRISTAGRSLRVGRFKSNYLALGATRKYTNVDATRNEADGFRNMRKLTFSEDEVTLDLLMIFFNTESFSAQRSSESILVTRGLSTLFYISIDNHVGALKFRARIALNDRAEPADVYDLVQHRNNTITCCQFHLSIDDDGTEYFCGSGFMMIYSKLRLRELYSVTIAFSSGFAAGCELASEHNLIEWYNTSY
jgi:hypothetical protein